MSYIAVESPKLVYSFNNIASGIYQNGQKIENIKDNIMAIINKIIDKPDKEYEILTEENNFTCYIDQFMINEDMNKLYFPITNINLDGDYDDRSDMSEPDEELLVHSQAVDVPNTKTCVLYAFTMDNSDYVVSMSYNTESKTYRAVLYSRSSY
jgi:hypothetical protein